MLSSSHRSVRQSRYARHRSQYRGAVCHRLFFPMIQPKFVSRSQSLGGLRPKSTYVISPSRFGSKASLFSPVLARRAGASRPRSERVTGMARVPIALPCARQTALYSGFDLSESQRSYSLQPPSSSVTASSVLSERGMVSAVALRPGGTEQRRRGYSSLGCARTATGRTASSAPAATSRFTTTVPISWRPRFQASRPGSAGASEVIGARSR